MASLPANIFRAIIAPKSKSYAVPTWRMPRNQSRLLLAWEVITNGFSSPRF